MKSETYKNKAKEIKEQREKLKNCPRNAKRIEALKTEEKRLKAKAKEKKAEEGNKSNIKSASTSTKKPSTSPSKEAKLEAGLHQLGLGLANESSKGIKVDVFVEYDDEGNPHIDTNELSKAISKTVQDAPYEFDPVVAKKIKMRQRIKEIDNISTKNKDLSKSELSALKKEKATLEKDVEK